MQKASSYEKIIVPLLASLLGISLVSIQSILIRELLATFYGNELIVAIFFFLWFSGSAIGSLLFVFLKQPPPTNKNYPFNSFLILIFFSIVAVALTRAIPLILSFKAGMYPSIFSQIMSSALVILPVALVGGWLFPYLCMLLNNERGSAVSIVLMWEAIGFMVGGLFFSFFLAVRYNSFLQILLSNLPILLAIFFIYLTTSIREQIKKCFTFLFFLCCILIAAFFLDKPTEIVRLNSFGIISGKNIFSSDKELIFNNSRYQKIVAVKDGSQYSLYCNNYFFDVFPDKHLNRILVHLLLAQNPFAKKILIIGGNPFDIAELLFLYKIQRLCYVEPDNDLVNLIRVIAYNNMGGENLLILPIDPIAFLRNSDEKFDVVITRVPNPGNILVNRLYTVEFYNLVKQCLATNGFFYTSIEVPPELYESSALNLLAIIRDTLQKVFPKVLFTYGTHIQFFAGNVNSDITLDASILYERISSFCNRNYFAPEYFMHADELSKEKIKLINTKLQTIPEKMINTIYKPIAIFYQTQLSKKYINTFPIMDSKPLKILILSLSIFFTIIFSIVIFSNRSVSIAFQTRIFIWFYLFTAGLFGMVFNLIMITLFQSFFGYLYSAIALISALFMIGFAMGSFIAEKAKKVKSSLLALLGISLLKVLLLFSIIFFETLLMKSEFIIYSFVTICGLVTACCYILFLQITAEANKNSPMFLQKLPGIANFADLFGAANGAILFASILLTLIGIYGICFILICFEVLLITPMLTFCYLVCKKEKMLCC